MPNYFKSFTLHDLILIAALSAIGLAIKPIINPMIHIVSSSLRIPGGSLSGGFLMMWMVLARVIINKPGTALIFGLAQGITVMLLGFFGSHGVFSIVSYTLPGLMMEIFALICKFPSPFPPVLSREKSLSINQLPLSILFILCLYCIVANMTGSLVVAIVVMQLPFLPLMISVVCSMLSGMLGGYFALIVLKKMMKYEIF
ncbi:MAG: ECF transporter S component [Candidatus Cloacimonetes bacterium]|nr:ECF transporter S component [Candidatus Cloacimonadota bacterium]